MHRIAVAWPGPALDPRVRGSSPCRRTTRNNSSDLGICEPTRSSGAASGDLYRYQRTATVITSGGNRNPANAHRRAFGRAARGRRIRPASSAGLNRHRRVRASATDSYQGSASLSCSRSVSLPGHPDSPYPADRRSELHKLQRNSSSSSRRQRDWPWGLRRQAWQAVGPASSLEWTDLTGHNAGRRRSGQEGWCPSEGTHIDGLSYECSHFRRPVAG